MAPNVSRLYHLQHRFEYFCRIGLLIVDLSHQQQNVVKLQQYGNVLNLTIAIRQLGNYKTVKSTPSRILLRNTMDLVAYKIERV